MGKPAAKNLVEADYELLVNDVRDDPVEELEAHGAEARATPREVAADSDVMITFLPEGNHVRQVALGGDGIIAVVGTVISVIQSDRSRHCGILAGQCSVVSAPASAFVSVC
jgi:3-hydroxyisobutyrate dehydrogenase-like beta-hydroxyacid dehydrogenase